MTDKEALFLYRIGEAEETLADAESMLKGDFSPRSITNRAYYAVFYSVLALFLKSNVDIRDTYNRCFFQVLSPYKHKHFDVKFI